MITNSNNNHLFGHFFYLSGSIDNCREIGKQWREDVEVFLKEIKAISLNPYKKSFINTISSLNKDEINEDYKEAREESIRDENYDRLHSIMKEIVAFDLRMVDKADAIIYHHTPNCKTCGSYDEIFMADSQRKPVLVVCTEGLDTIPQWLYGRLNYHTFFECWDDLFDYLNFIDRASITEKRYFLNRDKWKLFDYKEMFKDIYRRST